MSSEIPYSQTDTVHNLSASSDTDIEINQQTSSARFRRPKRSLWPAITILMLLVTGIVGWRIHRRLVSSNVDKAAPLVAPSRLPVRVVEVQTGLAQAWVFDEGTAWPLQRQVLNFQASGDITYIDNVNGTELREGDGVARGQLLATIDDRRQNSSIQTAEADIDVAVNQRNQANASFLQTEANLEKAKSDLVLAQSELRRYQSLFEQGAISESDRDIYQNQVVQAEAALKTAEQDVRSAEDGVRSSESSIGASQARLNETEIDLEDTQLVSPIDGIVAYINIREGEYWDTRYLDTSSAQRAIETAPIVVMDPQSFEVELEIQTDFADAIRPGQRAYVVLEQQVSSSQASGASEQILLDIAQQRGTEGQVFSVSPSQTPGSRAIEVSIRDLQQVRNLQVGGRVYVWIEVEAKPDAVMVPLGTLVSRDQQFYAFVVNDADGTVQRRQVTRGIEGLSGVEILSGVEPGERVVVEGQNRLVDGTPVEVVGDADREFVQ